MVGHLADDKGLPVEAAPSPKLTVIPTKAPVRRTLIGCCGAVVGFHEGLGRVGLGVGPSQDFRSVAMPTAFTLYTLPLTACGNLS